MQKFSNDRPVVLLWGGTGGHIFPLVSLKKVLSREGFSNFHWIGERESLEERTALEEGIAFHAIRSGKLRRYFSLKTLVEPFNVLAWAVQSYRILRVLNPAFVFSKGGYVSLPAAFAAKLLGIPVFLQESDAVPGLSNRWVGKFSDAVFLGFAEAAEYFPGRECVVTGQLLNPDIAWGASGNGAAGIGERTSDSRLRVLAVGGSLGSARVFEAVYRAANDLPDVDFEVVLGKLNVGLRKKFETLPNVVCHDFLSQEDIAVAYARSDVVVTRAGATSLAEIEASGTEMVIVPLEGSANDHQWANARAFAAKGYEVLPESSLSELASALRSAFSKKSRRSAVSAADGVRKTVRVLLGR